MEQDFSIFFSTKSLIIFILVLSRVSGMLITAPLFSTFPIPHQLKVGLSAMCAFIMYPFVLQHADIITPNNLVSLFILLLKELGIGILIGFTASLLFVAVQIGGQIISMQMGLAIANALDPVTKQNVPVVGQFYLFLASMVFIILNGHQWLFSSVYDSYHTIPLGMDFTFSSHITEQLLIFTSKLFLIAYSLIVPIFSVLFVTTLLMGIVAKIMPQMNIFMVAMPIQIYIGLSLMLMLMPSTAIYLLKLFRDLLINVNGIFS